MNTSPLNSHIEEAVLLFKKMISYHEDIYFDLIRDFLTSNEIVQKW